MPATPTKNSIAPPLEVGGANDALHIIIPGGKVVAWIDSQGYGQGHLFSTATVPGGSSGNIQANNGGAFAGIPGSNIDFTNGLVTLAPTGTGIALTVKGDAHSSAVLELLASTGVLTAGSIIGKVPNGTTELDIAGKSVSGTGKISCTGTTAGSALNSCLMEATPGQSLIEVLDHSGGSVVVSSGNLATGFTQAILTDSSGEVIDLQPGLGIAPPSYTVALLPAGVESYIAYATDGRKVGEGAGSGTGVPVYFSNSQWRVFSTDAQVQS